MTTRTMERTYGAPEVCSRAGVTYRQLDYWIRTSVVQIPNPTPGSGENREFTGDLIAELKLIRKLLGLGFRLSAIRREGPQKLQTRVRRALK